MRGKAREYWDKVDMVRIKGMIRRGTTLYVRGGDEVTTILCAIGKETESRSILVHLWRRRSGVTHVDLAFNVSHCFQT